MGVFEHVSYSYWSQEVNTQEIFHENWKDFTASSVTPPFLIRGEKCKFKLCNTPAGRSNSISLERSACLQEVQDVTSCRKRALLGDSVYQQNIVLIRKHKISWERKLCHWNKIQSKETSPSGVSINSKNWVFYKSWYLRLEFFISMPNVVFYKNG